MPKALSLPWRQGKHIAFTGIDGSGKSTHAGKLTHYMQGRYGLAYFAEPRTDLTSQLLHILALQHGRRGRRSYFGDSIVDFAKAFDVVRDYYATIAPLLAAGMHVVEPRSIYCRIAMAMSKTGTRDEKHDQVLAIIPKPDVLFWIDTDPKTALARIEARGIDREDLGTLQGFSRAYQDIPERDEWVRINGNGAERNIQRRIREHVDRLFS